MSTRTPSPGTSPTGAPATGPRSTTDPPAADASRAACARAAAALSRWLASGATQAPSGAFCGWRDEESGELSAPYPEITGYILTFLAGVGPTAAARATTAADWLAARAEAGDFSARPEKTRGAVYTFDVAMAAHGLLRLGRTTAAPRLVDAGLAYADVLVRAAAHGPLPPVVPGTEPGPLPAAWSTRGRVHLLKAVQALLAAADEGLPGAMRLATSLTDEAHTWREPDAFPPPTQPGSTLVSLHALCYAAEGLWMWADRTGDARALDRSRALTAWVWRRRLPTGGFPGFVDRAEGTPAPVGQRQSDVVAQALRLALLHRLPDADTAAEAALLVEDLRRVADGQAAVPYRPGAPERHLNTWASMFAAQALGLAATHHPTMNWQELV
ncbi:hypothetical protein [Streptomyces sp. NPDC017941]|uniref:hypothetical protein n=1 Tax=unclassified Streptomyces TaxID=2593676 RepID=UPI0037B20DE8